MSVLVGFAMGALAGRVLWVMLRPVFASGLFERTNVRGITVPVGAGVVLPIALIAVEAGRALVLGMEERYPGPRLWTSAALIAAVGFCLLGLFDDLAGTSADRGFRGHLRALVRGRLTTGGLKLLGGGAVAVLVVAITVRGAGAQLLVDAALVALAANLANLLDRAPGRVLKVASVSFVALVLGVGATSRLVPVAIVVGASVALAVDDLRERLMLGDAGANVLGGVLGLGVVVECTPRGRMIALGVVVVLNAMSEVVSFSRVIERVPPLRALDRIGRRT